jgi:molybdenum cofactor cytidylyltransferase
VRFANTVTPHQTTVVLGFRYELLSPFIKGAKIIVNPNWAEGIGASIAYGVASLPASATAVLILLCDQVALTLEHYTDLVHRFELLVKEHNFDSIPILCSSYAGSLGVPAVFPKQFFTQLCELKGDTGAKKILCTNPVVSVPLEVAAIDIDTQEHFNLFLAEQI